jgi:SPP1 gp7 family putative phage head morphogenesis protein
VSSTQYLSDSATRHAVFLQRYGGGQSKEATKLLYRIRRDINARLSQEPTEFQRGRLEAVLRDINGITAAGFSDIGAKQISAAQDLVRTEAQFSVNLFNKASTIDFALPTESVLIASVMSQTMSAPTTAGITITDALKQFGAKKSAQIAQIITDGVIVGDATPVIAQKLGGVINTLQRRQLDTLVRTIANHTSSVARLETYKANDDIIEDYIWLSTLDNSTTLICGGRDRKLVNKDLGGAVPPAHWGCRSTTIPKVKPEFDMGAKITGDRPSIGAEGVEQVSARTTYGGWLKKQPKEFIDEALGPERSKLFRAGKFKIEGFTDPTGRVYTLEQLNRMNPIAFIE